MIHFNFVTLFFFLSFHITCINPACYDSIFFFLQVIMCAGFLFETCCRSTIKYEIIPMYIVSIETKIKSLLIIYPYLLHFGENKQFQIIIKRETISIHSSRNPMSSSSDNVLLITAGYDRTIRFWQPNTAAIYRTIMHEDSVGRKIRFSVGKFFILANELFGDSSAKNFISSWKSSTYKNV